MKLKVGDQSVDTICTRVDPETGIMIIVANRNKDNWHKFGLYLRKYRD
jgi:hypothetical protein